MEIIESLAWAAFLGTLGQGVRSVDGLTALYKNGLWEDFSLPFLLITLAGGAMVAMAMSLGSFVGWDNASTYFLMGYAGTDFIEKRARSL